MIAATKHVLVIAVAQRLALPPQVLQLAEVREALWETIEPLNPVCGKARPAPPACAPPALRVAARPRPAWPRDRMTT